MISKDRIEQIGSSPEKLTKLYSEIVSKGAQGFIRSEMNFNDACHLCVHAYIMHYDYVHANNVMQMYKSEVGVDRRAKWFDRYSILIYGQRTPLYFIDDPEILFSKLERAYTFSDDPLYVRKADMAKKENARLQGVLELLVAFYIEIALREKPFIARAMQTFLPYAVKYLQSASAAKFSEGFFHKVDEFLLLCKDIESYKKKYQNLDWDEFGDLPDGYPKNGCHSADEHAKEREQTSSEGASAQNRGELKYIDVHGIPLLAPECVDSDRMILAILGSIPKSGIRTEFENSIRDYRFRRVEHYDYDEIKNKDIRKLFATPGVSNYFGILAGPTPHSGSGKGDSSSIITKLETDSCFPPVERVIGSDGKLKISLNGLLRAFSKLLLRSIQK